MMDDPYSYEAATRRRIAQTDWAKLHKETDRAPELHTAPRRGPVNRFRIGDGVRRFRGGFLREWAL
jgi:hypothetical protein